MEALMQLQSQRGKGSGSTDYFDNAKQHPKTPTVMVVGTEPGRFGGRRIHLRKLGSQWISIYTTVQFDPQGDPRWFIDAVGREAADYFGFSLISKNEMLVPDPDEFRGALAQVKRYLESRNTIVPISFYTPETDANVKVEDYVKTFAEQGAIPLAPSGNHLIHDLSFHTGAIFLPENLVALKRQTLRYLNAFAEAELSRYAQSPTKLSAVRYYLYLLRMHETINVDLATGILSPALVRELGKQTVERSPKDNPSARSCSALTNGGRSPPVYLNYLILNMWPSGWAYGGEYGTFANHDKLISFNKALPLDDVAADLAHFVPPFSIANESEWSQYAPYLVDRLLNENRFGASCHEVLERSREIRDAAVAIRHQF